MEQPKYTDCRNCGTCDHNGYACPCGCHGKALTKEETRLARYLLKKRLGSYTISYEILQLRGKAQGFPKSLKERRRQWDSVKSEVDGLA